MKFHTTLALVGALGLGATILLGQRSADANEARAQETYFASGQIESRVQYEDGRREGLAERFYSNGAQHSLGRYEGGRMEGEWQFWHADGSVDQERTGHYAHGEKVTTGSLSAGS